jgi:uncharacterized membrane protein
MFLRLDQIGDKLLWHDEVYTRVFAAGYQAADWQPLLFSGEVVDVGEVLRFQQNAPGRSAVDTVRGLARDEPQHPPLYYVLARLVVSVFGDGIGALRALSAAAGIVAIAAMYGLARELYDSAGTATTAAALLAVSPVFVLFSQEAREYSLWSVFVLASSWALLRALRSPSVGAWAAFSVLGALGLYKSFSMAGVMLAQVAFVLVGAREHGRVRVLQAAGAMAVSGVLFAPWMWMLWQHFEAFRASMQWASDISIPTPELLTTLALNLSRPLVDFWHQPSDVLAYLAVAGAVGVIGVALSSLRDVKGRALVWLLVAVPLLLLLVPDLLFGGIRSISTRYLLPTLLAVLLAVAHWVERRPVLQVGLLTLGAMSSLWNGFDDAPWTKGISTPLPRAAALINAAPRARVVGNFEQHHPGNLFALSHLLRSGTEIQVVPFGYEWEMPAGHVEVYLFGPNDPWREEMEDREGVSTELVVDHLHVQLWRVHRAGE